MATGVSVITTYESQPSSTLQAEVDRLQKEGNIIMNVAHSAIFNPKGGDLQHSFLITYLKSDDKIKPHHK